MIPVTKSLQGWKLKHLGGGVFEGEYVGGDEVPDTGIFTITHMLEQNPTKDSKDTRGSYTQ